MSYHGFRYYFASLGRFINRDPLEERGGWNLYSGLKQGASNPYAGASGVEGTSWSTEWEQAQDRLLSNTSLPHTTQAVTFDGKRNNDLPGSSEGNQKTYSANATGHYSQGGALGTGPKPPPMTVDNPALGNVDINLYIYSGNNPINSFDALGLWDFGMSASFSIGFDDRSWSRLRPDVAFSAQQNMSSTTRVTADFNFSIYENHQGAANDYRQVQYDFSAHSYLTWGNGTGDSLPVQIMNRNTQSALPSTDKNSVMYGDGYTYNFATVKLKSDMVFGARWGSVATYHQNYMGIAPGGISRRWNR